MTTQELLPNMVSFQINIASIEGETIILPLSSELKKTKNNNGTYNPCVKLILKHGDRVEHIPSFDDQYGEESYKSLGCIKVKKSCSDKIITECFSDTCNKFDNWKNDQTKAIDKKIAKKHTLNISEISTYQEFNDKKQKSLEQIPNLQQRQKEIKNISLENITLENKKKVLRYDTSQKQKGRCDDILIINDTAYLFENKNTAFLPDCKFFEQLLTTKEIIINKAIETTINLPNNTLLNQIKHFKLILCRDKIKLASTYSHDNHLTNTLMHKPTQFTGNTQQYKCNDHIIFVTTKKEISLPNKQFA